MMAIPKKKPRSQSNHGFLLQTELHWEFDHNAALFYN